MSRRYNGSKTVPRRTYNRRPMASKRGPSNKTLSKKIRNIENNLMELKWKDFDVNTTPIGDSGVLLSNQNYIQLGDTASTRTGSTINPTSITLGFDITSNNAEVDTTVVRCIVFWDGQSNGADPPIFNDNALLDANEIDDGWVSPRNYTTIDRFTILWDKTITLSPDMMISTAPNVVGEKVYPVRKRFKLSRKIKYDANAGDETDLTSNSIHVLLISNQTTNLPQARGGIRMYYRDS